MIKGTIIFVEAKNMYEDFYLRDIQNNQIDFSEYENEAKIFPTLEEAKDFHFWFKSF